MARIKSVLIWIGFAAVLTLPVVAAAFSPYLQYRTPIYIAASFAGIIGLILMVVQPLLAAGFLPGVPVARGRKLHRWVGLGLVLAVIAHVAGLWITSPPDVIDAMLLVSATPFSIWGVIAMWAVFGAALLAVFRKRFRLRVWRLGHTSLVAVTVVGTILHALLIEGTMESMTKVALCGAALFALVISGQRLRSWTGGPSATR